jgi:hypothetical protein
VTAASRTATRTWRVSDSRTQVRFQPLMVWTCDRFTRTADACWLAAGLLSVRGTATPLEVAGVAEPGDGGTLVRAAATLDRRAVGIRAPRIVVGRVVAIEIDAWLVPPER